MIRIMFETGNGPAVTAVEVDPPHDPDSVDIDIDEPAVPRTITPKMNHNLLASLVGYCRRP